MFGLHLLDLMVRFQQQFPDLVFDVLLSDDNVNIVEEGRNVAVVLLDLGLGSHLVSRPLISAALVLCASPDYVRAHPPLRQVGELSNHRCIASRLSGLEGKWTLLGPEGELTVLIRASLQCQWRRTGNPGGHCQYGMAMLSSYPELPRN